MNIFTKHPHSVGETYYEHFIAASSFGVPMIFAGGACLLHGIFPFLFEKTGSTLVGKLYDRMVVNRIKAKNLNKLHQQSGSSAPNYVGEWCI